MTMLSEAILGGRTTRIIRKFSANRLCFARYRTEKEERVYLWCSRELLIGKKGTIHEIVLVGGLCSGGGDSF